MYRESMRFLFGCIPGAPGQALLRPGHYRQEVPVIARVLEMRPCVVIRAISTGICGLGLHDAHRLGLYCGEQAVFFLFMPQNVGPLDVPSIPDLLREHRTSACKLADIIRVISGYLGGTGRGDVVLAVERDERLPVPDQSVLRRYRNVAIGLFFVLGQRIHRYVPEPSYQMCVDKALTGELADIILRVIADFRCSFRRDILLAADGHFIRHLESIPHRMPEPYVAYPPCG